MLKKCSGKRPAHYPVGVLLDRHWEAVFSYALLCADGARAAGVLTSAAFTRLFGETIRQAGPTAAWRPQLLVTVRRIAAEWQETHRRRLLRPELSRDPGGGNTKALLRPSDQRRLLAVAFRRLPELGRCLLWHTEVEAEPLTIPSQLLGLDEAEAPVELIRACEQLRTLLLSAHLESAPEQECRHFNRMLDVTFRRGGVNIDPDLRRHLERCGHCRLMAHELERFNGTLTLSLAEAVLGWAAREYTESRPGRNESIVEVGHASAVVPSPRAQDGPPAHAAKGPGPRVAAHRAKPRIGSRMSLVLAIATVSALVAAPLVIWSLTSGSHAVTRPNGTPSGTTGASPGAGAGPSSTAGAGDEASTTRQGGLRNVANGLCLGVEGRKPVAGAEVGLTECGSPKSQAWLFEKSGGLLRDVSVPDLCLDSHFGYLIQLMPCTGAASPGAGDMRYDLTDRGTLLPRAQPDLALAPAATKGESDLVLKPKDGTDEQRWTFESSALLSQTATADWGTDGGVSAAASTGASPGTSPSMSEPSAPGTAPTGTSPSATPSASASSDPVVCDSYYTCQGGWGNGGGYQGGGGGRGGRR